MNRLEPKIQVPLQSRPGPPTSILNTAGASIADPTLKRNLLVFALFLVLLGIGSSFYLLSLFGLLMLIPALLSSSRPPLRPAPPPARQETRRITPPPLQQPAVALSQVPPKTVFVTPTPIQTQTYSPSLFPKSIFPSNVQVGTSPQPVHESAAPKPAERDELLEIGTILALLRLALG